MSITLRTQFRKSSLVAVRAGMHLGVNKDHAAAGVESWLRHKVVVKQLKLPCLVGTGGVVHKHHSVSPVLHGGPATLKPRGNGTRSRKLYILNVLVFICYAR